MLRSVSLGFVLLVYVVAILCGPYFRNWTLSQAPTVDDERASGFAYDFVIVGSSVRARIG